ncbi:hypothetical protein ACFWP2_09220 [Kitasatospora sp. NPDC058444]|uniref:hypothetical protein n=1 Tax=Kitasatospora sp. NPDC058444 TaxID=3346504 RepID=UPI0036555BDD
MSRRASVGGRSRLLRRRIRAITVVAEQWPLGARLEARTEDGHADLSTLRPLALTRWAVVLLRACQVLTPCAVPPSGRPTLVRDKGRAGSWT